MKWVTLKSVFAAVLALCAGTAAASYTNLVGGTGTSVEALETGQYLNPNADDEGDETATDRLYWYSDVAQPALVTKYSSGEAYSYSAGNSRAAVFKGAPQEKYLGIDLTLEGGCLERAIVPRAPNATGVSDDFTSVYSTNGVWADALVRFTVTSEPPAFSNDDRIVVWARDETETGGGTVLAVSAGYRSRGGRDVSVRHYSTTNAVVPDKWYRVTIRNVGDMTDGGLMPGFVVYIDGHPAVAREDNYDIGQKSGLASTFFNAAARLLVEERRLFPSVVPHGSNASSTMTRLAVSGIGAIDDVSFCSTNMLSDAGDGTVLTITWDFGVESLKYVIDDITNAVDVAGIADRFLDVRLGDVQAADIEMVVTYKTELSYMRGTWTGENGCEAPTGEDTVFCYSGGHRNPIANVKSKRDLFQLGGEGGYGSFKAAYNAAVRKGGQQTIAMGTNFTLSAGIPDNGRAALTYQGDIILDLAGFALKSGKANAATVVNESGHLRIIDTSSTGPQEDLNGDEKGSVTAYAYNTASNVIDYSVAQASAYATLAIRNCKKSGSYRNPFLQIDAGYFNGQIELESGAQDCLITGGYFFSTNSETFYLAESVTNTKHWAWNAPYWHVTKAYDITYDDSGLWQIPDDRIQRYTRDTQCTALPVPTLEHYRFDGWWMTNHLYCTVGKGSGPTNSPNGNLVLTPRWTSLDEPGCYVWTGAAAPDVRWVNPRNWNFEGTNAVPAQPTDKVLFPARDTPWLVDLGQNDAKALTWYLYGSVSLSGTNDFRDVVLHGTNTLCGSAILVYEERVPSNLGTYLSAAWRGLVRIRNVTNRAELADCETWGVNGSTVVFNGVNASHTNRLVRVLPYTLRLEDLDGAPAWVTDTGFTGNTISFAELSGSGAFVSTNAFRHPTLQVLKFRNSSSFTGRILATSKRIVFGDVLPVNSVDGTATFAAGIRVPGSCDWTFANVAFRGYFTVNGTNGCAICRYTGNADIDAVKGAGGIALGSRSGHLVASNHVIYAFADEVTSLSSVPQPTTSSAATNLASAAGNATTRASAAAAPRRTASAVTTSAARAATSSADRATASSGTAADETSASSSAGTAPSSGSSSSAATAIVTQDASSSETTSATAASLTDAAVETAADERAETSRNAGAGASGTTSSAVLPASVPSVSSVGPVTASVSFVSAPAYGFNFTNVTLRARVENSTDYWKTCPSWDESDGVNVKLFFTLKMPNGTEVTNPPASGITWTRTKSFCECSVLFGGLERGLAYVANCHARIKDNTGTEQVLPLGWAEGLVLTPGSNAVYIAETADTFARVDPPTGTWADPYGIAEATNGLIVLDADLTEAPDAMLSFEPSEISADHQGYLTSFRAMFEDVADELPDTDALYGITLVEGAAGETRFAVLEDGVWTSVATNVFAPEIGVEYRVSVKVDESSRTLRYFVAPSDGPALEIASCGVSADAAVGPGDLAFTGCGALRAVDGELCDGDLYKLSLSIDSSSRAGTNFIGGTVVVALDFRKQLEQTDQNGGSGKIVAKDSSGAVVDTKDFSFSDNQSGTQTFAFDGLETGRGYTFEASVSITNDAGVVTEAYGTLALANLREDWNWIAENGDTFEGAEEGTGTWDGTNGVAFATGTAGSKSIAVRTEYDDDNVTFEPFAWPTNHEMSIYELRSTVRFEDADVLPTDVPASSTAWGGWAMTYEGDAGAETDGCYSVAILHDGAWEKIPRTTFAPELGVNYAVSAVVDAWNSNVCWYVTTEAQQTTCLAQLPLPVGIAPMFAQVHLHGDVTVHALTGEYWDPNLARGADGAEYRSFAEAIAASGEHDVIDPLWYCTYQLTDESGRFTIHDPNGYLSILPDKRYRIVVKVDGTNMVYAYSMSDNWIDYADYADLVYDSGDGCLHVKSEEGLSYLAYQARQGTNYFGMTVVLDRSLTNLAEHGWTPIAGFEGIFDGRGYVLTGLNDLKYRAAVSNEVGHWGFGLFDGVANAEFRNIVFSNVVFSTADEVSGLACGDGVGALVGNAHGSIVVSNVTVASGSLRGADAVGGVIGRADNSAIAPTLAEFTLRNVTNEAWVSIPSGGFLTGTKAAGLLGYADSYAYLSILNSANYGKVTQAADLEDVDTYTAGLVTFAGGTEYSPYDYNVQITDSANWGDLSTRIFRLWPAGVGEPVGGNVGRLFCNASDRDVFGSATVSGNEAQGDVDAVLVYNDDRLLDSWPAGNFAPCIASYDSVGSYRFFFDANSSGVVPLDPVYHTARMSQARFENDVTNTAGVVNDIISASSEGATVTLSQSMVTWDEIVADRNLTIDLGGNFVEATFYNVAFRATAGASVLLQNGIVYAEEGLFTAVDSGATLTLQNVVFRKIGEASADVVMNGAVISATNLTSMAKSDYKIQVPTSSATLTIDNTTKKVYAAGVEVGRFASYYDVELTTADDIQTVKVMLNTSALPTLGASTVRKSVQSLPTLQSVEPKVTLAAAAESVFTAAEETEEVPAVTLLDGFIRINALSTYTGLYYGLQHRDTLDGEWKSADMWFRGSDGQSLQIAAPAEEDSGFYRIEVTDHGEGKNVVNE